MAAIQLYIHNESKNVVLILKYFQMQVLQYFHLNQNFDLTTLTYLGVISDQEFLCFHSRNEGKYVVHHCKQHVRVFGNSEENSSYSKKKNTPSSKV